MTDIRKEQRATLYTIPQCVFSAYVTFASHGGCLLVSIQVNFFNIVYGISGVYLCCKLLGLRKMRVTILVIANKRYNVSPLAKSGITCIALRYISIASVQSIVNGFIYNGIRFAGGFYRKTSYSYI